MGETYEADQWQRGCTRTFLKSHEPTVVLSLMDQHGFAEWTGILKTESAWKPTGLMEAQMFLDRAPGNLLRNVGQPDDARWSPDQDRNLAAETERASSVVMVRILFQFFKTPSEQSEVRVCQSIFCGVLRGATL